MLFLLVLAGLVQAARFEGFSRYYLIEDDVVFNDYGQQVRIGFINVVNSSVNVTLISETAVVEKTQFAEGEGFGYKGQCLFLNKAENFSGSKRILLTWSDAPCLYAFRPFVFGVAVLDATENSLLIEWKTNFPANSSVLYWTTNSTAKAAEYAAFNTLHRIKLTSLRPDAMYFFNVTSCFYGNATNCTSGGPRNFSTRSSTGFIAEGARLVDYPLHKRSPISLEGFRIEFMNATSEKLRITLGHFGEDLCLERPGACVLLKGIENKDFAVVTGMLASLKDSSSDTAIVTFSVPEDTRFPPAVIIRPYEKTAELNKKTTVEVLVYEVNYGGRILQANFSYEDNGTTKTMALETGKNAVEVSFTKEGAHALTVNVSNDAGYSTSMLKSLLAVKPTAEEPVPTPATSKKQRSPTTSPTLSAVEQVKKKLAEEQKPFSLWDYVPYAAIALVVLAAAVYLLKFRKPKETPAPPKK